MSKLEVGDYGAIYKDSTVAPIYFERKGINDLFNTMTNNYDRFKEEMARAKEMGVKLVLAIEGTPATVLAGTPYSKFSGESMMRKLMTLWLRYDLMPMFCGTRAEMARVIFEFYEAFGRNYKAK